MAIPANYLRTTAAEDYDRAVRPGLRTGDLLLCSGRHPFSRLIQTVTRSEWSHVALIVRLDAVDRILVMESVESIGVRTVSLRSYVQDHKASGHGYRGKLAIARHRQFGTVDQAALKTMSQFAIDRFGYPYDNDEIAKIAARITLGAAGIPLKSIAPDDEYICSEYVARCYDALGLSIQGGLASYIAPADFAADPMIDPVAVVQVR